MTKATQFIKDDHRAVQTLFLQFNAARDDQFKRHIATKAMADLRTHTALEEEILYPALRDVDGVTIVEGAIAAHEAISELIDDMEHMDPGGAFAAKFQALAKKVQTHIVEEERYLLPTLAHSSLDETLGERLIERRHELMGTSRARREPVRANPHPAYPQKPGHQHVRRI